MGPQDFMELCRCLSSSPGVLWILTEGPVLENNKSTEEKSLMNHPGGKGLGPWDKPPHSHPELTRSLKLRKAKVTQNIHGRSGTLGSILSDA